jgi:hypothetical protein
MDLLMKRARSVQVLFRHFEERAKIATPREVTDDTTSALVEAAFLRPALGAKCYVVWLNVAVDVFSRGARFGTVS